MREMHQGLFDIFALALPRGHGFRDRPPIEAWRSDGDSAWAAVTRHVESGDIGLIVLRRREDRVWTIVCDVRGLGDVAEARERARAEMKESSLPELVPAGTARRPSLYDLGGRTASETMKLLTTQSYRNAGWLLGELYLALPRPDRNWASDLKSGNFHTRLWEAQLLASFREQGLLVTQPEDAPDFRIENGKGEIAWIEAVTANPPERYEHVNAKPTVQPEAPEELFFGPAALRFAKTIGSKLQRRYDGLEHVEGHPFALALADFQAGASMVWSREALIGYLTGIGATVEGTAAARLPKRLEAETLIGNAGFKAGLFRDDAHAELSAVIFTNACTLSKFNRIAVTHGASPRGRRYIRYGKFEDSAPGALDGIPFSLDVTGDEYRSLWPDGREPWCAELEVFHNPFAMHPLPGTLLPEATHWRLTSEGWDYKSHYKTRILWSRAIIADPKEGVPTYDDVPAFFERMMRAASG